MTGGGRRVCIVGAGVSGLTSVKCCLEEGLEPMCLEQDSDLGGLWNFTDKVRPGYPSLYRSCVINTSKEMTCYSDFPIPKEYPNFMHHSNFKRYLELYADHFGLRKYIRFRSQVQKVKRVHNGENGDLVWQITFTDLDTGSVHRETTRFLLACHGHLHLPSTPKFPGLDDFGGEVIHTHEYKDFRGYEDKTVLVIGIGNSATDVTCELSRHAKHVYMSTRRGTFLCQRTGARGAPFDHQAMSRLNHLTTFLPGRDRRFTNKVNAKYDHVRFSLAPTGDKFGVTFSDDLPMRILVGDVTIKTDIQKFTKNGATFTDGTRIEDIDVVVMGTGYTYTLPFLDKEEVCVKNSFPFLYKFVFPVGREDNSLAVIGLVQPLGALPPILETQARWATRVFAGRCRLPPPDVMEKRVNRLHRDLFRQEKTTPRYSLKIHYIDYCSDLSKEIGCQPRLWRYFFTDPGFWWTLVTGPLCPAQWRLDGPGRWSGARQAILSVENRTWFPLHTRGCSTSGTASIPAQQNAKVHSAFRKAFAFKLTEGSRGASFYIGGSSMFDDVQSLAGRSSDPERALVWHIAKGAALKYGVAQNAMSAAFRRFSGRGEGLEAETPVASQCLRLNFLDDRGLEFVDCENQIASICQK
ncbi:flavin-containing monooxygenase 5-like, partial [Aplysia californica]|uniref:Flavin-containing monooxygenase n=1 Tax=Aplysia californica TaxID=6500 RepID=A0ABM0JVM8_APLCA